MRLARFESKPQRFAGPEQVALPYDLIERSGTKLLSEGCGRFALAKEIIH